MQKLMDPKGFMSNEEKLREEQNQPDKIKVEEPVKVEGGKGEPMKMEPEFGFKPKGPEPTRYGDWEVKGKCVDF